MPETSPMPLHDSDTEYRAIEQTLLESARGRWFLAEHGRRARRLDMAVLEDAIGRLSSSIKQPPPVLALLRQELETMSAFISDTKDQMLAKSTPKQGLVSAASEDSGSETGRASSSLAGMVPAARMLRMAEEIHELTWTLQADELSPDSCEAIARHASMLYAVSRQQAMESERALSFANALDDAANRLTILLDTLVHELATYEGKASPPPAEDGPLRATGT